MHLIISPRDYPQPLQFQNRKMCQMAFKIVRVHDTDTMMMLNGWNGFFSSPIYLPYNQPMLRKTLSNQIAIGAN